MTDLADWLLTSPLAIVTTLGIPIASCITLFRVLRDLKPSNDNAIQPLSSLQISYYWLLRIAMSPVVGVPAVMAWVGLLLCNLNRTLTVFSGAAPPHLGDLPQGSQIALRAMAYFALIGDSVIGWGAALEILRRRDARNSRKESSTFFEPKDG